MVGGSNPSRRTNRTDRTDWRPSRRRRSSVRRQRADLGDPLRQVGPVPVPVAVRGYATLSNAGAQTNQLGITVHVDAALKRGASREEIAEALAVAVALNAGAALVYSARVMDAVDAHG
ncbi:carboxymuconolactone decarboxylase family protein [Luteimonas sp. MC1572]|nr:carboxymuconolactone decarboxylase family protein [Luteimonas sp. MC1572]QQO03156.1 carboxymuconolactone decarboxylase family protein [Luteimonas sp. MC1572]